MGTKVKLIENVGRKASAEEPQNTNPSRVIKENKAMTQEI